MKIFRLLLTASCILLLQTICCAQFAKNLRDNLNQIQESKKEDNLNSFDKDGTTKEETTTSQKANLGELGTFPSLLSPYVNKNFKFVPQLNIIASKTVKNNENVNAYYSNIFISTVNADTSYLKNGVNFIIPETSSFGIEFNWLKLLSKTKDTKKAFVLDAKMSFLGKSLPTLNENNEITGQENVLVLQNHIGLEYLFLDNVLSGYINVNSHSVLSNVESFENYFSAKQKTRIFPELGLRAGFDFAGTNNSTPPNKIFLDLGFIVNTGEISPFTVTNDPVTPKIRIGYNILFNKLPKKEISDNQTTTPNTSPDLKALTDKKIKLAEVVLNIADLKSKNEQYDIEIATGEKEITMLKKGDSKIAEKQKEIKNAKTQKEENEGKLSALETNQSAIMKEIQELQEKQNNDE